MIVRPDGRLVTPLAIAFTLDKVPGILRYQFIQEEPARARVRLVLGPGADWGEVRAHLDRALRPHLGPELTVEYEREQELPLPPSGKFRSVISKVAPPNLGG